jgi:hypothetical protein
VYARMSIHGSTSFSLPFLDGGGPSVRFGELEVAELSRLGSRFEDTSLRADAAASAEKDCVWEPGVGLPGAELFERVGGEPLPEAASVRRNSTHSRENDY